MKIVNTIKTILLLSVVVILPSCLDLDPQDQMSDANLWQTPNDYKLYVRGEKRCVSKFGRSENI